MHAVGQHSTRKNEIQLSVFELSNKHALSHKMTKVFNMDKDVRVLDITPSPEDGLYKVSVTYVEEAEQA